MPEPLKRDFNISDDEMLQNARTKSGTYTQDLADFTAFDADFDAPYGTAFDTTIDTAEATDDDETVTDQQVQLTNVVLDEMKQCREKFQDSKFFIEKAFPTNVAVQNEFGFNDYNAAQKGQASFTKFMLKFHRIATKYSAELAAANYNAAKITEILTRHDKLRDADLAQIGRASCRERVYSSV